MNATTGPLRGWLQLTIPIALLLAAVAGTGLFAPGLYNDPDFTIAQLLGQDLVSLAVALPVLVVAALLAGRGSLRALMVWLGVIGHLVYTYAIVAFHVHFNLLFLAYVALLGCSLFALAGGLAAANVRQIRASFSADAPVRLVASFLAVLAVLYYLIWLVEILPAMLAGEVPPSVKDFATPTNGIHVMDMAVLLPAMILAAVWLTQQRPVGYLLAGVLLVKIVGLGLVMLATTPFTTRYGQPAPVDTALVTGVMAALSLWLLVRYLGAMR